MTYLVETTNPRWTRRVWSADCAPKLLRVAKDRATQVEAEGWLARITKRAPAPAIDYTTGALHERGKDEVIYTSPNA